MRKHSLRLSVLLLTLLLVTVLALGLAACDPTPQTPNEPTPEEHTTHTPDSTTEWHSDETEHWHLCQEGGEPLSKAAHTFELTVDGEQKTLACSVCGKTVDASAATLKSNDTEHWYEIEKDGETIKTAPVAHDLALLVEGEQKSLKCSVCEKTLDASDATMNKNAEGHWYEIEKDGKTYKTASTSHSKSATAVDKGEQHAFSCTVCQYEYAPEDHTPGEDAHKVDENNHAFTCTACGKDINEAHKFEKLVNDGTEGHHSECIVCDAETEKTQHKADNELHTEAGNANHWNLCECGEKMNATAHSYDLTSQGEEGHTGECECGATSALAGHTIKYAQEEGGKHHAYCADCDYVAASVDCATEEGEYEATDDDHTFTCDLCEQSVTKAHTATRYRDSEDGTKHYQSCEVCGHRFNEAEHNVEGAPYVSEGENHYQACTICHLQVTSTIEKHTVKYTPTEDGSQHTGACEQCDYTEAAADHIKNDDPKWISWEKHGFVCTLCEHEESEDHDCAPTEAYCPTCKETRYPGMTAEALEVEEGEAYAIYWDTDHKLLASDYPDVVLPTTYKGVPITTLKASSYGFQQLGKKDQLPHWGRTNVIDGFGSNHMQGTNVFDTIRIPEGYTTLDGQCLAFTEVRKLYLPSTITTLADDWMVLTTGDYRYIDVAICLPNTEMIFNESLICDYKIWHSRGSSTDKWDTAEEVHGNALFMMQLRDDGQNQYIWHGISIYTYDEDGDHEVTELAVPESVTVLKEGILRGARISMLKLHGGVTGCEAGFLTSTQPAQVNNFETSIRVESLESYVTNFKSTKASTTPFYVNSSKNRKLYVGDSDEPITELTLDATPQSMYLFSGLDFSKLTLGEHVDGIIGRSFTGSSITEIHFSSIETWIKAGGSESTSAANSLLGSLRAKVLIKLYIGDEELKNVTIDDKFASAPNTIGLFYGTTIESVTFTSTTFTSIGVGMFQSSTNLTSVNFGEHITDIGASAFMATGLTGKLVIPKSVKTIGNYAFSKTSVDIILEKGAELTSFGLISPTSAYQFDGTTLVLPSCVKSFQYTSGLSKYYTLAVTPNLSIVYYLGDKETWDQMVAEAENTAANGAGATKTQAQNTVDRLKKIKVFFYADADPGEGQRADKWRYVNDTTPAMWESDDEGNYLLFDETTFMYDVNTAGKAEWSLLLQASLASEGVTFSFEGENATVSGEGNFMPTKLGVYQVTAKLETHDTVTKTLTIIVYSSALQLGGTVNGEEVTENGTKFGPAAEEGYVYSLVATLKADDKPALLVNHAGTIEAYPITEDIFDKAGSEGYEAFATLGEEGLTITAEGKYLITVTFTQEGYKVTIGEAPSFVSREIQVHVWGFSGQLSKGSLKHSSFMLTEDETTYTVTIEITGAEINTWSGSVAWPNFQLVLIDGETTKYYNHDQAPNTVTYTKSGYITYSSGWEGNLYWDSKTKPSSTAKATFTVTCEKVGDDVQITKCSITAK